MVFEMSASGTHAPSLDGPAHGIVSQGHNIKYIITIKLDLRLSLVGGGGSRPGAVSRDEKRLERRLRTDDSPQNYLAVIKVAGIGGGGVNAINRMIEADPPRRRVHRCEHRTRRPLLMSDADAKTGHRSGDHTRPSSRGASDPEVVVARSDQEHREEIEDILRAPTWSSSHRGRRWRNRHRWRAGGCADPRDSGALTIGVVTRPFAFEGRKRATQADLGINELKQAWTP